ncbi:hypothetical protein [Enterococcus gallinarum]|uniref:hypothetical protein n=1 Tax=Enterococcus gallinarum TaxID=1353 RepID=UPI0012E2EB61|nr:hypothetical protein [Enterococcus gallinarum]MUO32872.1 hypothetical protein [Enterococcus gallinarum]
MIALADLILDGVIYCEKNMQLEVLRRKGKYSVLRNPDGIKFKVSNEVLRLYFAPPPYSVRRRVYSNGTKS